MLVSYNWLKDFLDLDEDPKDLGEKITRTGCRNCISRPSSRKA